MYKDRLISDCQFVDNDSRLNFYKADSPVHSWYTSCPNPADEESGPILSNTASIDIENDGIRQAFEVGMPYYGIHTYKVFVDRQSTAKCQISYFALVRTFRSKFSLFGSKNGSHSTLLRTFWGLPPCSVPNFEAQDEIFEQTPAPAPEVVPLIRFSAFDQAMLTQKCT